MEILIMAAILAACVVVACVIGFVIEVIKKIVDFDHEMFSGDFWEFEWVKTLFGFGSSVNNQAEVERRVEEEFRAKDAYDTYKSYRNMQMDENDIDDFMRIKGYSRDERDEARRDYNSGCYIATASLQGDIPYDDLLPLKQWRYEVMEKSEFGNKLSNHYRRTAPELAKKVDQMPVLASFLRECFIRPSLVMVSKKRTFFRNALLYINFFFVLGLTTVFTKFKRF